MFTFTINKIQIQTPHKIAELIEAGSMEECLLPNILYNIQFDYGTVVIPFVTHNTFIFILQQFYSSFSINEGPTCSWLKDTSIKHPKQTVNI